MSEVGAPREAAFFDGADSSWSTDLQLLKTTPWGDGLRAMFKT